MHEGQLENWKNYLDDNPRRLMMKRQNPELFTVLTGMKVVIERCWAVGNRENFNKNCTYDTMFCRLLRHSSLRNRGTCVGIRKSSASRTPPPKAENTNI